MRQNLERFLWLFCLIACPATIVAIQIFAPLPTFTGVNDRVWQPGAVEQLARFQFIVSALVIFAGLRIFPTFNVRLWMIGAVLAAGWLTFFACKMKIHL